MSASFFQALCPLDVRDISTDVDKPKFRLLADYVIRHNLLDDSSVQILTVPRGFETDFGSIPDALKGITPAVSDLDGLYTFHDYLYTFHHSYTRGNVDSALRRGWILFGIPRWKAWIAYYGVRAKAGSHWK